MFVCELASVSATDFRWLQKATARAFFGRGMRHAFDPQHERICQPAKILTFIPTGTTISTIMTIAVFIIIN